MTDLLHGGQDKAGKRPRGQWPQVVPAARTQCRVHPWRGASAAHATRIWSCSRSSTNTIEDAERIFYFPHNRTRRGDQRSRGHGDKMGSVGSLVSTGSLAMQCMYCLGQELT